MYGLSGNGVYTGPLLEATVRTSLLYQEYGKSLIKLKYVLFAKNMPVFFTFVYSRPEQDWVIWKLTFNDKIESLDD